MSLDPATVKRIAILARIRVDDDGIEALRNELNGILGWIDQLNAVDVSGVAPLAGAPVPALPMRADSVTDGAQADTILGNAPARIGDFFAVPKVVE